MSEMASLEKINLTSLQINLTLVTFIVMCIVFILSAISYMKLTRNVPSEHLSDRARDELNHTKTILFWILFFTGVAMLLFGYMILYYPKENTTVMYLGTEECSSDTCSEIGDITVGSNYTM